jgi:hypothetical protein
LLTHDLAFAADRADEATPIQASMATARDEITLGRSIGKLVRTRNTCPFNVTGPSGRCAGRADAGNEDW